jgi:hypothetical protein
VRDKAPSKRGKEGTKEREPSQSPSPKIKAQSGSNYVSKLPPIIRDIPHKEKKWKTRKNNKP